MATRYKRLSFVPTEVEAADVKKSFNRVGEILVVGVADAERYFRDVELPVAKLKFFN
jgi:hypothetical protein